MKKPFKSIRQRVFEQVESDRLVIQDRAVMRAKWGVEYYAKKKRKSF